MIGRILRDAATKTTQRGCSLSGSSAREVVEGFSDLAAHATGIQTGVP